MMLKATWAPVARARLCLLLLVGTTGAAHAGLQPGFPPHAASDAPENATTSHIGSARPAAIPLNRWEITRSRSLLRASKATCQSHVLAGLMGPALVDALTTLSFDCVNEAFYFTGSQAAVFDVTNMTAVAAAAQARAATYSGQPDHALRNYFTFLRAAYYVQFYHPDLVVECTGSCADSIQDAIDELFSGPHAADVTDAHGALLIETIYLVDAARLNARNLTRLTDLLENYSDAHRAVETMQLAQNAVMFALFRGHQNADFQALMGTEALALGKVLSGFIVDNAGSDIGTPREYLVINAAGELGHLLRYQNTPGHEALHIETKQQLDFSSLGSSGAPIHVRLATSALFNDAQHCDTLGICAFVETLDAAIFAPGVWQCESGVRIRAQSMTKESLSRACMQMARQRITFFQTTGSQMPLPDDDNDTLEVVVFASRRDYAYYSPALFSNGTSNGGVYLEGDPGAPGDQARFITFEDDAPGTTANTVKNLHHEFVHYLDGRHNMAGAFDGYPIAPPTPAVWYIEGLAEYLSYESRSIPNAAALTAANEWNRFSVADLIATQYHHAQERVYAWSYLLVRYLVEQQPAIVGQLFELFRQGEYGAPYDAWAQMVSTYLHEDFEAWAYCFHVSGGAPGLCNQAHGSSVGKP